MTREQSIVWLRKQVRLSGGGLMIFWGFMAFFWVAMFFVHAFSISEPFHYESVIVALLYLSVSSLVRTFQMGKLRTVLNVLLGESWDQ